MTNPSRMVPARSSGIALGQKHLQVARGHMVRHLNFDDIHETAVLIQPAARPRSDDRRPLNCDEAAKRLWLVGRQLCGVCACSIWPVTGRCGMAAPSVNTATNE